MHVQPFTHMATPAEIESILHPQVSSCTDFHTSLLLLLQRECFAVEVVCYGFFLFLLWFVFVSYTSETK